MNISPHYINRPDLDWFEKVSFTIDDKIEQSRFARALYRWGLFLPTGVRGFIAQVWWNSGILPMTLLGICQTITEKLFHKTPNLAKAVEIVLFSTTISAMELSFPYFGWGFLFLFFEFYFVFWFLEIMDHRKGEVLKN